MKIALLFVALAASAVSAKDTKAKGKEQAQVLKAQQHLTDITTKFGALIEGAAVDKQGNFYAVHFNNNKASIGRGFKSQSLLFQDKTTTNSWFNGIRFNIDSKGAQEAFLADVKNHRVVRLSNPDKSGQFSKAETFCQSADIIEPNDIAVAHSTGRLFLSGMRDTDNTKAGDGDLWTCDRQGKATKLGSFFRTNGIEVSPDEKVLYLSESVTKGGNVISNVIHAFDLDAEKGTVSNKRLFVDFGKLDNSAANDVDGMRTDVDGNLYVTRWGAGKVAKISPSGKLLAYIQLAGISEVTNLEFAGPQGKDLFIVGACKSNPKKGCIDKFSGASVGRAFSKLQK
ncbi:hypothetical protein GGI12_003752 [Dipsacomyces acuminosporus]|nr:hypothetical protein GGI12_003752 [Dipsacomyces acuminosporus]